MSRKLVCPNCKAVVREYQNPAPTVDLIIECVADGGEKGIVLIERKNYPYGWALPGGYVDCGETLEEAARREALEETSLQVELVRQFHCYSDPRRDPRQHNISVVFIARARGVPEGADDALRAAVFIPDNLPSEIAFDHRRILDEYFVSKY